MCILQTPVPGALIPDFLSDKYLAAYNKDEIRVMFRVSISIN
jgi:hypothetical protein